jgi:hypothetical protein
VKSDIVESCGELLPRVREAVAALAFRTIYFFRHNASVYFNVETVIEKKFSPQKVPCN